MVDFSKLRDREKKSKPIEPTEIFRRLPKPPGINDLYTSQSEVLHKWFNKRTQQDTVLKLHTGGGKTLVGLLMAQSTINETKEPVLYLTPTIQLVKQAVEKAQLHGIPVVSYERGKPLHEDFVNGNAIMVATYKALFNGRSKFGIRGPGPPQYVSAIILDDAHVAFSVIRESFTLEINASDDKELYAELAGYFRHAFKETDKLGTFDDIISGAEYAVIEVPYWAWHEKLDVVRELLRSDPEEFALVWPLLRDSLHLCHALISKDAFTITPVLPLVNEFPTFAEAPRRIYMSATISDDTEIIRTFDANPEALDNSLTSRSLAGISERMILIPDLMPFKFDLRDAVETLIDWTTKKLKLGSVILVPSDRAASKWAGVGEIAQGSEQVERLVGQLQKREIVGPVVFANRYDGIDLPGDSCRLLVLNGLPAGTSIYELFRASALYGGSSIVRMLAQRIEQGIGRGARGSGDHCVVVLLGSDISGWIAKDANFQFLTSPTKAQLEMGADVSKEVRDLKDLAHTIKRSYDRDEDWVEYHAETLAELVDENTVNYKHKDSISAIERKAFNLWHDGYPQNAIARIEGMLEHQEPLDNQTRGWMEQLAARIADNWGNRERADELQRGAYSHNKNLLRPRVLPPYRPLSVPGNQEQSIVNQIKTYRFRRGFLQSFEETVSYLHHNATSNQFEQALKDLANMIGFSAERHDHHGEGPDVLWLLPNKVGFVIEAKSRKKEKNALTKKEHGQLLVAEKWFQEHYKEYRPVRISVHPYNKATKAAVAGASYALMYEKLSNLVADARSLLASICESQLPDKDLIPECERLLKNSGIHWEKIESNYLVPFEETE